MAGAGAGVILLEVPPDAGRHCETTALGVLLRHEGIELSEPLRFGLGEGLGFVHWDAKNLPFPFLGGRSKPMTITRVLAARLGLRLQERETTSPRTAWRNLVTALDGGRPVGLQLDCYHLDHFTTKVHFGGHVVAAHGYDETSVHLVDTAQQGGAVTTSRASLERARGARGPMTARNLSFTLTRDGEVPPVRDVVGEAVRATARAFLDPPIANLGHRGIRTAAARVPGWFERGDDPAGGIAAVAELMERGGTGGGFFRVLYRDFLAECAVLLGEAGGGDDLRRAERVYATVAQRWTEVSQHLATAAATGEARHLVRAAEVLRDLADRETEAMRVLSGVGDAGR